MEIPILCSKNFITETQLLCTRVFASYLKKRCINEACTCFRGVLSKLKDKKVDVVTSPHLSIPITVELFFNTLRLKTEQKV